MDTFDVIVIGAGPGGYVCAIRAAQLGLKTALVEKNPTLGGTCLNIGCIPSKALLHSTEVYAFVREKGASHGIRVSGLEIDVPALMKKKAEVVSKLVKGVEQLVKARGIEVVRGTGRLAGHGAVEVTADGARRTLTAKHIVLATGSKVAQIPPLPLDRQTVVSSDEAIAFDAVPKRLVVVGGGAIGLELGSVWARLGSEVTVVEFLPRVAAGFDEDLSRLAERFFKKQGLRIETSTKVTGLRRDGETTVVLAEKNGQAVEFPADKVLVAVGRVPFTEGLGLDEAGVKTERGRVVADAHFRTSVPGVYAIGDLIHGPMLAHKAEEEGVALAELLAGKAGHVNYAAIPNVIYTDPEIASVGLSEQEARSKGLAVNVGKFNLAANGRAIASDATDGLVKVIADAQTDRLLGVQIIARNASELIGEAVAHFEYGGSAEDLGRTIHAHPTLSEAVKEAALAVSKSAIHGL